jgi:hypothetical protein
MGGFAAFCSSDGSYISGPPPPWLEDTTSDSQIVLEIQDFEVPVAFKIPLLVWVIKAFSILGLEGWHRVDLLSLLQSAWMKPMYLQQLNFPFKIKGWLINSSLVPSRTSSPVNRYR